MGRKSVVLIVSAILGVLVLIIGISLIVGYNGLVELEEDITGKYQQVENRLLERHDKIGLIVDAIDGLQTHELAVYQAIVDARIAYANSTTMDDLINADNLSAIALTNLLAVMENYPDIAAAGGYYMLIDEISSTESGLAFARREYNLAVQEYNVEVRKFPKVLYARLLGFEQSYVYWKLNDGEDELPVIDFD